jgi:hypothetical protein
VRVRQILSRAVKVATIVAAVSLAGDVTTGCSGPECSLSGGCGLDFGITCESGFATTAAHCDITYDTGGAHETCSGTRTYEKSGKTYTFHSDGGSVTVEGLGTATCARGGGAMPGVGPGTGGQMCFGGEAFCSGACVHLDTDALNCGTCGNVCSGACLAGHCLPKPSVLASGHGAGVGLAVDDANAYWTEETGIMKVALAGGTATHLVTDVNASALVVDATNVYWTKRDVSGAVMKVPIQGGSPTTIASGQGFPWGIAVDATSVYWTTDSTVMRASLDGGAVVTLASGQSGPEGIAVDANNVYWTTNDSVMMVPRGGGATVRLATGQDSPRVVAVWGANVYWASGNVFGHPTIMSLPTSGGTPTTLGEGAEGVAVDATGVYWTDPYNGMIRRAPLDGGSVTVLAGGQKDARAIAVGATNVYWITADGISYLPK